MSHEPLRQMRRLGWLSLSHRRSESNAILHKPTSHIGCPGTDNKPVIVHSSLTGVMESGETRSAWLGTRPHGLSGEWIKTRAASTRESLLLSAYDSQNHIISPA